MSTTRHSSITCQNPEHLFTEMQFKLNGGWSLIKLKIDIVDNIKRFIAYFEKTEM